MAVVDELVTILGIDLKQDVIGKLNSLKAKLGEATRAATRLGAAVSIAATGVALFIRGTLNKANELHKLSEKTKISTTALQEWEYAADKSGLEAKAITSDLANLQKTMASPIPGEFNATMAMFGVRVRNASGELKTTDQLLLEMSGKFEKMSEQKAAQWASKLGISDDTLLLLRRGREGVEALRKEAHKLGGIIPEKSIRMASEFRRQLSELQFAMKGLGHQAAIATVPALEKIVKKMKEFIAENKAWVSLRLQEIMEGVAGGVERVWSMLEKLGEKFNPVVDAVKRFLPEMTGAELVTHLVTGALTLLMLALSPLIAKFALVAAKAILLSVVVEDFFTFLEGGESTTGRLFDAFKERWPELYGALEKAGEFIKENFVDALGAAWKAVKFFGGIVAGVVGHALDELNRLVGPVLDFASTFEDKFPGIMEILRKLGEFIKNDIVARLTILKEVLKVIIGLIGKVLSFELGRIKKVFEAGEWVAGKLGFGGDKPEQGGGPRKSPGAASQLADAVAKSPLAAQEWALSSVFQPLSQLQKQFSQFQKQSLDVSLFQKQQIPSHPSNSTVSNSDNRNITINIATNDPVNAGRQVNNAVSSSPLNTNTPGQFSPTVH